MSSKRSSLSASQVPRLHVAPPGDRTYGDVASEFASRFGLTPDPWQRLILDDWLRLKDGKWAARTCGLSVPRQNGKNAALEVRELFGTVLLGEKILHTAHEVKTAKKHFRRLQHFFGTQRDDPRAKFRELNDLVVEVRKVNGEEAIILSNGASIEMAARSKNSGRGFTVDVVVFDEAQQLDDDAIEALVPTKSAAPLRNPQVIYAGTPPGPHAQGEVFTRQRTAALAPKSSARSWHEWSLAGRLGTEPGMINIRDIANAYATNPALGFRMGFEIVEDDLADLSEDGYARERLGMWAQDDPERASVISADLWGEGKPKANDGVPPSAMAVDMSHDRALVVAGCWRDGTQSHVQLLAVDYVTDPFAAVEFLVEKAGKRIPVVIDTYSPAAALLPELKARKVKVVTVSAGADMARACGGFYDDVIGGRLTHGGQEQLTQAVEGATKRKIGDAGGWGWDRRDPSLNIAPLVAATLARYGAALTNKKTSERATRQSGTRRAVVL